MAKIQRSKFKGEFGTNSQVRKSIKVLIGKQIKVRSQLGLKIEN